MLTMFRAMQARGLAAGAALWGLLALSAPAQTVDVIEYYNASQDHYFISSLQADINALDTGHFPGWVRTGLTFKAYPTAAASASPVCRFYIPPGYGDSHFFSASPMECAQVAAKWPFFIEESINVMYVDLPDTTTGVCPAGDISLYRVWDNRADTNHRYTTDPAVRAQMVMRGWIAEGYGTDQVIMCSPLRVPSPTVFVSIDESANRPIDPGFVGYNFTTAYSAVSYLDPNLQSIAATIAPGWLRYVGGTSSLAFNWNTGLMQDSWVNEFLNYLDASTLQDADYMLKGKLGGAQIDDIRIFASAVGAKGLIVSVNGFTDSAVSAGNLATYVSQKDIPVLAWELSNEPYLYTKPEPSPLPVPAPFFKNATDYLDKMSSFSTSIKNANPGSRSLVAIFATDAGSPKKGPAGNLNANGIWDQAIASYATKYWDAITFHHYPTITGATNRDGSVNPSLYMNTLNFVLSTATTGYVTDYLAPLIGSNTPVIISEFGPQSGNGEGGVLGTIYGGVYAAEYAIRMANVPQVKYVGMHQLLSPGGISYSNMSIDSLVKSNGANGGTPVDTIHPPNNDFGYFSSAQGIGYGLAANAVASTSLIVQTSVTGGSNVNTLDTTQSPQVTGTMPAVYAQAFSRDGAQTFLVITNKGSQTEVAAISDTVRPPTGTLEVTAVSSQYWDLTNTSATTSSSSSAAWSGPALAAVSSNAVGNVPIPPYSVVVVHW